MTESSSKCPQLARITVPFPDALVQASEIQFSSQSVSWECKTDISLMSIGSQWTRIIFTCSFCLSLFIQQLSSIRCKCHHRARWSLLILSVGDEEKDISVYRILDFARYVAHVRLSFLAEIEWLITVKRDGEEANRNVPIYRSWTGSWTAGFWKQGHYFVRHHSHGLHGHWRDLVS